MTVHIVNTSGGKGSWATGRIVATERMQAGDHLVLLFADTNMEDEDLYRFLDEAVADILECVPEDATGEFVRLADGRDVWQVFRDKRFLGNSRIDPCSKVLKRDIIRKWIVEHYQPEDTVVYLGIDWTEEHRFQKAKPYWQPYAVAAPLCEFPYMDGEAVSEMLEVRGIEPPRLYAMGFPHNNCGGFCVKSGLASFRLLLEQMPERYAYHEQKEAELREYLDKDVAILTDRSFAGILAYLGLTEADIDRKTRTVVATGEKLPVKVPLTLTQFRERIEAETIEVDPWDLGGCACFTPDDYEADMREPVQLGLPLVL